MLYILTCKVVILKKAIAETSIRNGGLLCDYLLKWHFCKTCGLQYVGSTVERFRFRWSNYKNCQREAAQGGTPPQSFFHQYFLSEGHHGLVNDCEITLINKTDSSDPTRRECFWIRLHITYYPFGLNIEEEMQLSIF